MNRRHFALTTFKHWVLAKSGREREGGQSIIILALGLIALLGFAGLVFDGGTAYAQYRRMQNAADAGALAGATELTKQEDTSERAVCEIVNQYASEFNGLPVYGGQSAPRVKIQLIYKDQDPFVLQDPDTGKQCNPLAAPHQGAKALQVTVSTTFNTFFLGLFGMSIGTSTAHAAAEYGVVLPQRVQPIAKRCDDLNADYCGFQVTDPPTIKDLWESDQSGNYGWLTWAGTNNSDVLATELSMNYSYIGNYIDDVDHPPCSKLDILCWVQGAPGIKTSGNPHDMDGVRSGLDQWIASGKPMIIIIYDEQSEHTGSNSDYRIKGFAAFFPTSYDLDHKHLWGYFGHWVQEGQICEDCKDMGLYTVRLIPDIVTPPPPPPQNGTIYVHVLNDLGLPCVPEPWGPDYYVQNATIHVTGGAGVDSTWTTYGISANSISLPPGNYTIQETNPSSPVALPRSCPNPYSDNQTVNLGSGEVKDVYFLDYTTDNADLIVKVYDGDAAPGTMFAGANVKVVDSGGGTAAAGTTPITGTLTFTKLPIGSYTVSATAPDHTSQPQSITLTNGITGTVSLTMVNQDTGSLRVHVNDDKGNALPNVQVTISGPSGTTPRYTDGGGQILLDSILIGSYTLTEINPSGYVSVPSSADTQTAPVQKNITTDVYFVDQLPQVGTICVLVFDDITGDGNWSSGETLVPGALVRILNGTNEIGRWTTNGTEPHCYPSLPTGTYSIQETNPAGYYTTNTDTLSVTFTSTSSFNAYFGDRMATPTPSATPTKTGTPTRTPTKTATPTQTLTPTPGPSPTPTVTPIPGALCVTVFQDTNSNGTWDTTPPAPPPSPTPTVEFTPEVLLGPQDVSVLNAMGTPVGTWDGSGGQPHCFNGLWPGNYTSIETNTYGYGSTTADSVTSPVQSSMYTSVFFGDLLCLARTPVMGQVTFEGGAYWLHWENVGADSYEIFGSFSCQSTTCPTPGAGTPQPWHSVAVVSVINYKVVQATDGTFFYVVARNKCGASSPSNIVALP